MTKYETISITPVTPPTTLFNYLLKYKEVQNPTLTLICPILAKDELDVMRIFQRRAEGDEPKP